MKKKNRKIKERKGNIWKNMKEEKGKIIKNGEGQNKTD
jgi:hypothetical protein